MHRPHPGLADRPAERRLPERTGARFADDGVLATRRAFLHAAAVSAGALALPGALRAQSTSTLAFGDGELTMLGDGVMQLPLGFMLPDSIDADEREAVAVDIASDSGTVAQPLNVSLWRSGGRIVLFDAGSGLQFLEGTGELPDSLAAAGVDPSQITDVVFTHAHPDHLWGVLDDFDDLLFTEATYHIHADEHAYWMADGTLAATPEARQSFVVGAQNRLPLLEDRLEVFAWGDEILPGIEAVDTHGHTPGHTSFALHANGESLMILGDALLHPVLSFGHARWPSGSDQDPQAGIRTRVALLDRLADDSMRCVGYHLPSPGIGRVERQGDAWHWVGEG